MRRLWRIVFQSRIQKKYCQTCQVYLFHRIRFSKRVSPSSNRQRYTHKTAFSIEGRIKNSPAIFQRLMKEIWGDLFNKVYLVYFDVIIIYSSSLQEHIVALRLILDRYANETLRTILINDPILVYPNLENNLF